MSYYHTPLRENDYSYQKNLLSPTTANSEKHTSLKQSRNLINSVRSSLNLMIDGAVTKRDANRNAMSAVFSVNR